MQNFLSVWSIKGGLYSAYTSKAIGFTALEDVIAVQIRGLTAGRAEGIATGEKD